MSARCRLRALRTQVRLPSGRSRSDRLRARRLSMSAQKMAKARLRLPGTSTKARKRRDKVQRARLGADLCQVIFLHLAILVPHRDFLQQGLQGGAGRKLHEAAHHLAGADTRRIAKAGMIHKPRFMRPGAILQPIRHAPPRRLERPGLAAPPLGRGNADAFRGQVGGIFEHPAQDIAEGCAAVAHQCLGTFGQTPRGGANLERNAVAARDGCKRFGHIGLGFAHRKPTRPPLPSASCATDHCSTPSRCA